MRARDTNLYEFRRPDGQAGCHSYDPAPTSDLHLPND